MTEAVGMLGVGRMGAPIARRLAGAGFGLRVYDVDKSKAIAIGSGAIAVSTPEEAISGAETVVAVLPTPEALREIMFAPAGLFWSWTRGQVLLDMGTGDPQLARELASRLSERGGNYLEAPVSGGVGGAAAGTLTVLAAGDLDTFHRLRPLLQVLSQESFYLGPAGAGHQLKLANNLMLAAQVVAVGEAWNIVRNSGIEPALAHAALSHCSATSAALLTRTPEPGLNPSGPPSNDYRPGLTVALMLKDLRLARQLLRLAGSRTPSLDAVMAEYERAKRNGHGDCDISSVCSELKEGSSA